MLILKFILPQNISEFALDCSKLVKAIPDLNSQRLPSRILERKKCSSKSPIAHHPFQFVCFLIFLVKRLSPNLLTKWKTCYLKIMIQASKSTGTSTDPRRLPQSHLSAMYVFFSPSGCFSNILCAQIDALEPEKRGVNLVVKVVDVTVEEKSRVDGTHIKNAEATGALLPLSRGILSNISWRCKGLHHPCRKRTASRSPRKGYSGGDSECPHWDVQQRFHATCCWQVTPHHGLEIYFGPIGGATSNPWPLSARVCFPKGTQLLTPCWMKRQTNPKWSGCWLMTETKHPIGNFKTCKTRAMPVLVVWTCVFYMLRCVCKRLFCRNIMVKIWSFCCFQGSMFSLSQVCIPSKMHLIISFYWHLDDVVQSICLLFVQNNTSYPQTHIDNWPSFRNKIVYHQHQDVHRFAVSSLLEKLTKIYIQKIHFICFSLF